jgi:hypothetical protein
MQGAGTSCRSADPFGVDAAAAFDSQPHFAAAVDIELARIAAVIERNLQSLTFLEMRFDRHFVRFRN